MSVNITDNLLIVETDETCTANRVLKGLINEHETQKGQ